MAFILRRPFAVSQGVFKQVPKSVNLTVRFIHHSPIKSVTFPKPAVAAAAPSSTATSILGRSKQSFQNAFRRTYMQDSYRAGPQAGNITQRLLYGAAIVGGAIVATNLIFNRETREDGGMPTYEREYLNDTFMHTGLGVGIIALAARVLHTNGISYRLMAANPWAVVGLGLVASIGTMFGTFYTPPEK
jgi:growth hormone-inducible transmembrane protein